MSDCPFQCQNGFVLLEALGQKVPCPKCNGAERYIEMTNENNPDNVYQTLKIPMQYRDLTAYSADPMIEIIRSNANSNVDAKEVGDLLNNISTWLDKSMVYRLSSYIHVPTTLTGVDMNKFVYSMQIKALVKGVGTMPFITANMLYVIMKGREVPLNQVAEPLNNPANNGVHGRNVPLATRLRYACDFDYLDYITSPLVFIDASAGTSPEGWIAIADLLSERAKLSLSTYVIGYWGTGAKAVNTGIFLFTEDMSRLDRLTVFEFNIGKAKKLINRAVIQVEPKQPDNLNECGVKIRGTSEPIYFDDNDLI